MATEKSFQLYINEDNVKQYFSASGGALNGAAIGGKYITMRTSSTTATFTMNDAGRDVLFPSEAAIAHKVDVWAQTIATLNNRKNTINIAIAGQNAITTEKISTSLTEHTGSVSGSFTKSNTSAVYVVKIANGFHAAGVRDTSITAYFTQYSCVANKVGNGIKSVSVSNAEPYEGETVTFSAELYNGANFDGWYSDESCTQLVSSSLTYSTTAAADLALYAKATIDADIYNCSAVAGENIVSVSVSDESVVSGDSATFTAQLNEGCLFDGWYSDSSYSTLVSTLNPYTTPITSDTTLYAKGTKISYSVSVGAAEHGIATVSANTAYYGDSVTFTFTPENEDWELYGWYSDEGFTQLVSESNPYTLSVTDNIVLYPKIGIIRYTITFQAEYSKNFGASDVEVNIAAIDFEALTRQEKEYLKTGEYNLISSDKVYDTATDRGNQQKRTVSASVKVPKGKYVAMYAPKGKATTIGTNRVVIFFIEDWTGSEDKTITNWPYYWYRPTQDMVYNTNKSSFICNCIAIAKEGISYVDATTPVSSNGTPPTLVDGKTYNAIFSAETEPGYRFLGWYSDEACTTLVSADNPAYIITPDTEGNVEISYTLYAKAIDPTVAYTVQVGSQPDGGSASVSASTATYGDVVTFTANITGTNREFYGWYSDSSYTNLVSALATYNHTVTGNTTLYPKSGKKRYTAILHPTYASDVRPYRGSSSMGGKAASPSVPQNVNVLANNTVDSSTYAYQSYRTSTAHTYGIAFWINNIEQLNSVPDNATIVDLYAQIGLSFSDTDYNSATAYSGTYTYLCEGDETPAIRRGTNVNIPISTNKTVVTINKSQMGDWTIKELKEGKLGFQINTSVKGASGTRQQRFYGIDVYVVYTIEDTSYKCESISDGHVDVSVSSHDVVPGGSCTWTAVQEGGYRFDGWYSDSNFKNLVSTSATYTTTINSNKTLYAKTHYHSRVVSRELHVPFGQGRTYFTGKDINGNILDPDASGSGWKPDFDMSSYGWLASLVGVMDVQATAASCNGAEYVSAVINNAGMNVLYPNDTAHPVKMDSHALLGRAALTATINTSTLTNPITEEDTIAPMVDGVQSRIWRPNNINDVPYNFNNLRLPSILNSTRNSTIEYRMHQYVRSDYRAIGIDDIRLTLYFEEYDFSAQIASDAQGIEAVTCSKAIGYEGDSVTYTVTLSPGVIWNGWYADPNCKTLVSTEQTYTTVPNGNLTLYASASTELATGTGFYIKQNGTFIEANAVYKKVNGVWEQQDDPKSLFLGSPSGSESNYIYCGVLES